MSEAGAEQILFRTAIAAVNSSSHLRVYTQDTSGGIRESLYEGGWRNGTAQNVIARGKLGTAIAATSKELQNIRLYYLSDNNTLMEACYDSGKGWYEGDLSKKGYQVAAYSKVAASFLVGINGMHLRVYAQARDNTIQEYGYDGNGWSEMTNLGQALPGTELASTAFHNGQINIRVYLQDNSLSLIEKAYDGNQGWYTGGFSVTNAPPRTCLATTSWGSVSIRVYYVDADNRLREQAYDGNGWYQGGFNEPCVPGSEATVIQWGSGGSLNLRVYFQKGTYVTGVTEWMWSGGGWSLGQQAIPPA